MKVLTIDIERPCLDHGYAGRGLGYASVRRPTGNDPKVLLHRWVFLQEHGYLPPVVMHTCDNPRCIEIEHLVAGDWDLNNKDRAAKGRSAKVVPSRQRLTTEQAAEIRERFARRTRPQDMVDGVVALSREFGVDTTAIYQIASGRTYR